MDPDGSRISIYLVLLLFLVLCNAFFAMSEIAVISLNDAKIRKMAQEGNRKAQQLAKLMDEPSRFLSSIQVGVTISGFLSAAVAVDAFASRLVDTVPPTIITQPLLRVLALIVVTLPLSFVSLVLGQLVPKRIAMQHDEKIAFAVIPVLTFVSSIERPFVALLSATTNGVLRLFGIDPDSKPGQVTEEEIRMMLDVGGESGNIEKQDQEMIHNIFEFDDRTVEDIMNHRTEIMALPIEASLDDVVRASQESGYSRIPVYRDDLDNIVGIAYIKDLLGYLQGGKSKFNLEENMREPLFILESTTCKKLLSLFQETKIQMAVVVDEYGGTAGLVTMEDLLESIVGNIQDEYDDEEDEIIELGGGRYQVDGLTQLDDVARFFHFAIDDEDDFDTIGGYLIDRIGQIPSDEEHPVVTIGNVRMTILEMDERRISRIEAELLDDLDDNHDSLPISPAGQADAV